MCVSCHHCTSKKDVAKINYFYYTRTNCVILGLPLGSYLRHIIVTAVLDWPHFQWISHFFIAQVFDREHLAVLYLKTQSPQIAFMFQLVLLRMATHV